MYWSIIDFCVSPKPRDKIKTGIWYFLAANTNIKDPDSQITDPFLCTASAETTTLSIFLIYEEMSTRFISLFFESAPEVLICFTFIFNLAAALVINVLLLTLESKKRIVEFSSRED